MDRGAWWAIAYGVARGGHDLATNNPPRDLPDPGIEPTSLLSLALAGGFFTTSATWEAHRST